jgi:DNA polymerase III alpha subunit
MNNNQSMYPIRTYVDQSRRDGVGFEGPDVNASQAEWSLQGGRLRVGLMHIVGVGEVQSQRILEARARRVFSGIGDFLTRTQVGDAEAENLILCGALDSLGDNRPTLLRKLFLHRRAVSSEFCLFPPQEIMLSHPPTPFPDTRRSADEWRLTGLPIRESYLAQFRPRLGRSVTIDSRQIAGNVGRRVTLAGLRETHRITKTHRGETMAFVTFGDEFGLFEAVLLPDAYQHNPPDLTRYGPHIITGTIQSHHDSIAIHADRIRLV